MALALAGGGALSLAVADGIGFLSPSTEAVFTLLFIAGWVLLAWAAIVGGVVAVHLVRAAAGRRRPALIDTVLVLATVAVIAGVVHAHPLTGSSSGVG